VTWRPQAWELDRGERPAAAVATTTTRGAARTACRVLTWTRACTAPAVPALRASDPLPAGRQSATPRIVAVARRSPPVKAAAQAGFRFVI
jgi:hypothetical protein